MTPHEIEAAFAQAVADAGLGLWSIPADGKLHRFKVPADKGRQLTGWAVLHGDGLPAGVAGDWRTGERVTWKGAGEAAKLSRADRRELAELRRKRKAALADIQGRAAAKAAALYERLPPAPADHPYLTRKKIAAGPCKVTSGGALMVLVRDADTTKAISLQFIQPNGEKRFLTGGRTARGCCFLTPITAAPVVIAEGYATGHQSASLNAFGLFTEERFVAHKCGHAVAAIGLWAAAKPLISHLNCWNVWLKWSPLDA